MRELTQNEIEGVSGGVSKEQVLNYGAAITATGAAILFAVGSPLLIPAAGAFAVTSGVMWLGSSLLNLGLKPTKAK
ncbi:MAG: hypothetical protein V4463_22190 [Pseudomonadota bacterium]